MKFHPHSNDNGNQPALPLLLHSTQFHHLSPRCIYLLRRRFPECGLLKELHSTTTYFLVRTRGTPPVPLPLPSPPSPPSFPLRCVFGTGISPIHVYEAVATFWCPVLIESADGGGMKGVVAFAVVRGIMVETRNESPKMQNPAPRGGQPFRPHCR